MHDRSATSAFRLLSSSSAGREYAVGDQKQTLCSGATVVLGIRSPIRLVGNSHRTTSHDPTHRSKGYRMQHAFPIQEQEQGRRRHTPRGPCPALACEHIVQYGSRNDDRSLSRKQGSTPVKMESHVTSASTEWGFGGGGC